MTTYDPLLDAPVDLPAKAPETPRSLAVATLIVKVLGAWMVCSTSALLVLAMLSHKPVFRAVICMGSGLVFLWCVAGGLVMYRCRDRVRAVVRTACRVTGP